MEESKAAWDEVGSLFSGLGLKLKEHFAQASTKEAEGGVERSDAAARDAMKEAVRKLGTAIDDAVDAVAGAAKDPAIAEDVRKVGQSLMHAFQSTFEDVSDDLRGAFARTRKS